MLSKIYLCPTDKKYGCTWEGSSDDILHHFSLEHEDLLFLSGSVNISLEPTSENCLVFADDEIYLLQTKINEQSLNIYLRYLGPNKIASNLTYDINILSNGTKLEKQYIHMQDGCFCVMLEHINNCFDDINVIECQLLVSGDFNCSDSNDSVFIQDDNSTSPPLTIVVEETDNSAQNEIKVKNEEVKHLSLDFQDALAKFTERNPFVKEREKRTTNMDKSKRASWNVIERDPPREYTSSLTRSRTFTSEDVIRDTIFKRQISMRSLGSIAESDIDAELKCANCNDHLAPPIFFCVIGHNICSTCYRDKTMCSFCDSEITAERNLELEDKSINHMYTCINKKNGCPKKLPYREIEEHEVNCTFCHYLCPMEECNYKSGYRNMVAHLSLIHSSVKMYQSFIAVFQKYQELFLVHETMGIFYTTWKQIETRVVWKATFCGPKARKFFCELKFKGKNFKKPLLLSKVDDYYCKEIEVADMKDQKLKAKHSLLTITR